MNATEREREDIVEARARWRVSKPRRLPVALNADEVVRFLEAVPSRQGDSKNRSAPRR